MEGIQPDEIRNDPESDLGSAEARLLARIAAGEREEPLIGLYQLYGRRLYALGMRMLDDRATAEEMVQETFVRIWQSADRYDPAVAPPRAWIYSIAKRVAVDFQRRAAVRPKPAPRPTGRGGDDDPIAAIPADDQFDRALTGMDVRDALLKLSEDQREVLVLGYHEQLTQSQIGAHLGIPLGTVKTRTYHGLRALRAQLEELRLL